MFILITPGPATQIATQVFNEPYQLALHMSVALARNTDEDRELRRWIDNAIVGDVLDLGGRFVVTCCKFVRTTNAA